MPRTVLAESIAEHMMLTLFGGTPVIIDAWRAKRLHGTPHPTAGITAQLEDILGRQIGLPAGPPRALNPSRGRYAGLEKLDHLEGFVAEHLWHLATHHQVHSASHVRLHGVSFRVTDSGADGFVIYEPVPGAYMYRLWEIKKNSSGTNPRPTAVKACDQLTNNATYYLQEISKVGEHEADVRVKAYLLEHRVPLARGHPGGERGSRADRRPRRARRQPLRHARHLGTRRSGRRGSPAWPPDRGARGATLCRRGQAGAVERTLNPELLRELIGSGEGSLPTPERLSEVMAYGEVGMITRERRDKDLELLELVGWYLFGTASSRRAAEFYSVPLRRQAFQVAAHLLDLALRTAHDIDDLRRAQLCFAIQIAYLRGDLHPNAMAIYRKAYPADVFGPQLLDAPPVAALHSAIQLLAGRVRSRPGSLWSTVNSRPLSLIHI